MAFSCSLSDLTPGSDHLQTGWGGGRDIGCRAREHCLYASVCMHGFMCACVCLCVCTTCVEESMDTDCVCNFVRVERPLSCAHVSMTAGQTCRPQPHLPAGTPSSPQPLGGPDA